MRSASGNALNSCFPVVNTRAEAKVLRVRFREGRNARPVLELNLDLGPRDVWTAAIVPASSDAGSPARLVAADASCTDPPIVPGAQYFGLPLVGFAIRTFNDGTFTCGNQSGMGVFSGILAARYSQHVARVQ